MATTTVNFGTNTAATITLNSLGDGSWRESTAVDNGTVKAIWMEVFVTILTTTTAGSDATVDVYLSRSLDGGTDYTGGIAGTGDAGWTPVGNQEEQLELIGSMPVDASETTARTYKWGTVVHDIPEDFCFVVENNTGAALGATTCALEYRLHKFDSA